MYAECEDNFKGGSGIENYPYQLGAGRPGRGWQIKSLYQDVTLQLIADTTDAQ